MKTEMKPGRQPPAVFQQSRRLRRPRSGDTERVRALLNRLQAIVPAAPKDRQLPQVQVIQHVINYICQLQLQVVKHPRLGKALAAGETSASIEGRLAGDRKDKMEETDRKSDKEGLETSMDVDREAGSEAASVQACLDRSSTLQTSGGGPSPA